MAGDDEVGEAIAFRAVLGREGTLYCVEVPLRVSRALAPAIAAHGRANRLPVVATANGGSPFIATLIPRGRGAHKLFLNGEVRKEAGASEGDRLALTVRADLEPRGDDVPADILAALREAGFLATFEREAPGKRQHIIDWIERVQSEDARERRIAKVIERMAELEEKRADRAAKKRR